MEATDASILVFIMSVKYQSTPFTTSAFTSE